MYETEEDAQALGAALNYFLSYYLGIDRTDT